MRVFSTLPFSRHFAMPSANTFGIRPIAEFVQHYLAQSDVSVDPFARDSLWATYRNDLNPNTAAQHHMDAADYCSMLATQGVIADLGIFDPPYSPRQISECYAQFGREVTGRDTQNGRLYRTARDHLNCIIKPGGIVLSFGWNSQGMGKSRGYELIELQIVAHGGAHNDTICVAERKTSPPLPDMQESDSTS